MSRKAESGTDGGHDQARPDALPLAAEPLLSAPEADALRLAAIIESSDDAIISKRLDGTITTWNRAAERMFGYAAAEIVGRSILTLIPEDRRDEETRIVERLRRGERVEHFETVRRHKSGGLLDISLTVSPIRRLDGTIIGASKIARDITQKKRAEDLLQKQAERLEILNRVARVISQDLDLERIVQTVIDEATKLSAARFGAFFYTVTGDRGEDCLRYTLSGLPREVIDGIAIPRNADLFASTFAGKKIIRSADTRTDPRFGRNAPLFGLQAQRVPIVSYLAVPVISASGVVIGALFFGHEEADRFAADTELLISGIASQAAVAIDNARLHLAAQVEIGQRREAQEAKDLLLHEIKHRVKNTLATVQALASQTLKETPADERRAFIARLHALSEAHDLLTQNDWTVVGLTALARRSLSPFSGDDANRIALTGPEIGLPANKALILTMVLHELGTNAMKYGSLSVVQGRAGLTWRLLPMGQRQMLTMVWEEQGGPAVVAPAERGFGMKMIASALQGGEGGARFDYREDGLEATLELPL